MPFNIAKCKAVHCILLNTTYQMKDNDGQFKDLPIDTEEKDLGVKFHSSMKFESHISSVVNKTNQLIGLIKRSFSFMDKDFFSQII